jgi:transcriptional regulator GlxA family with amidase domain
MRKRTRQVWFVVFPECELLDLSGPWAVLGHANEASQRDLYATQLVTPGGGSVRTRHGIVVAGARSPTVPRARYPIR